MDLTVNILAGSDLAARLPVGYLPVGKYMPLAEASMRQRGFEVQIISLNNTVSTFGAINIYPALPQATEVALKVVVDVRSTPYLLFSALNPRKVRRMQSNLMLFGSDSAFVAPETCCVHLSSKIQHVARVAGQLLLALQAPP